MGESGALVYASATGVFLGGAGVATSGAAAGVPLPATAIVMVPGARPRTIPVDPGVPDDTADLYVISTAGTQTVSFVAAQGG
jgi:hypothetical protein